MPVYFASDMHLRLDRPDRARRLARWVDGLNPDDSLYLVGDVCDFWFASRQRRGDPLSCEGLRSLSDFRKRGGSLIILVGNHDSWLGPYYQEVLGASVVEEPVVIEAYGYRVHLVHGHRAGGREPWKAFMESHAFLAAFEQIPGPIAVCLDRTLESRNDRGRVRDEARLVAIYRQSLAGIDPTIDLAVFGHVHAPLDDPTTRPRMVVLGGWHNATCYLRLDEAGASHVVEPATGHPVPA